MRKKTRLFAIAEALRARRTGVTAQQLADQFGVTLRTMYRDLQALQQAGVPLGAERGRGGGYALDKSYGLPPVNFTAREAAVLVALANHALAMRMMPFTTSLRSATDKVQGALSQTQQRELIRHLAEVQIVGVPAHKVDANVARVIEDAWFSQTTVRIIYAKPNESEVTRLIRLRNIVCDRGGTLLNCDDLELGQARQFRLDRIRKAALVETV